MLKVLITNKTIHFICYFTLLLVFISCKQSKLSEIPVFDKGKAFSNARQQVSFGPRVPNSEAHKKCKEWLVSQFEQFGLQIFQQNFTARAYTGDSLFCTNIIAIQNPKSKHRIILAAHWDSRPFSDHDPDTSLHKIPVDGADDGASGVAVLLEVARCLQQNPLINIGVDIILFDAEDYGQDSGNNPESWCLGSQFWSKTPHIVGYKADYGILLDMVGATNPRFSVEGYSEYYAPKVVKKVWDLAAKEGYEKYFIKETVGAVTDDHYFVNTIARIPMINIINRPAGSKTGFVHHWHTQKDKIDVIEPISLEMVGNLLLKLLYLEDVNEI
ncbi:MAG: M28 family peptidase [Bacteroidota bacterium]|nr:M28 family peptidase [Bacteroidota bacterium]